MGTDYRLFAGTAVLDLDTLGADLFNAARGKPVTQEFLKQEHHVYAGNQVTTFDRKHHPWKGVWCFIRDNGGEGRIVSEHQDEYDELDGLKQFSVFSRTGHWKRLGFGPT